MKRKLCFGIVFFCLLSANAFSQSGSPASFGKVTEKDFASKVYSIDSNANAVVIADIGSSHIEGNRNNFFSLVFKKYKRVHILNKNGFDAASVSIPLYTSGTAEEILDKLRATTYNLEMEGLLNPNLK